MQRKDRTRSNVANSIVTELPRPLIDWLRFYKVFMIGIPRFPPDSMLFLSRYESRHFADYLSGRLWID